MWIAFSLTAAFGAAATSLGLKQLVAHGGVVISTVAFWVVAGLILVAVVFASGALADQIYQELGRVKLDICYCSVYDSCWTVTSAFREARADLPQEVAACPTGRTAEFTH